MANTLVSEMRLVPSPVLAGHSLEGVPKRLATMQNFGVIMISGLNLTEQMDSFVAFTASRG